MLISQLLLTQQVQAHHLRNVAQHRRHVVHFHLLALAAQVAQQLLQQRRLPAQPAVPCVVVARCCKLRHAADDRLNVTRQRLVRLPAER
jgi:hypothetical protein